MTFRPSRPLIEGTSSFYLMSNESSFKKRYLFCSLCYNKIFSGKELLSGKCKKKKKRALFRTLFRAPPPFGDYTSEDIKTPGTKLQSFIYHPSNFQIFLFTRFGTPIWIKWRIENHKIVNISKLEVTSSKQISIIDLHYAVSDVKISRQSIESFSRNPQNKSGKKKKDHSQQDCFNKVFQ